MVIKISTLILTLGPGSPFAPTEPLGPRLPFKAEPEELFQISGD